MSTLPLRPFTVTYMRPHTETVYARSLAEASGKVRRTLSYQNPGPVRLLSIEAAGPEQPTEPTAA